MKRGKQNFSGKRDLQADILSITAEQRAVICSAIVAAGISYEINKEIDDDTHKKWKAVLMELHGQSSGKSKKIYKALATVDKRKIERILSKMV
jgi:hypothetical protein